MKFKKKETEKKIKKQKKQNHGEPIISTVLSCYKRISVYFIFSYVFLYPFFVVFIVIKNKKNQMTQIN